MILFDPKSIQILGADNNGNNVILCTMYVDNIADLPAPNAFVNERNVLSMGCRAIAINDNSVHRLNSAGQWVQIVPGNSTYTRAEIDTMISRIDATEAEDRAALIGLIDRGAKNRLKITAASQSYDDGNITFTVNTDQTVTVYATNSHAQRSLILADLGQDFYGKTVVISGCPAGGNFSNGYYLILYKVSGSSTITYDIGNSVTLTIPNDYCRLAIGVRANAVVNNLVFRPMICTQVDYDISPAYAPYAPTNRELYDMIQGYHP